jgi:hypothetical protein
VQGAADAVGETPPADALLAGGPLAMLLPDGLALIEPLGPALPEALVAAPVLDDELTGAGGLVEWPEPLVQPDSSTAPPHSTVPSRPQSAPRPDGTRCRSPDPCVITRC